jgi:predicted DNA-binding transcriptional regulator YafY
MSLPYIEKSELGYQFHGPVHNFDGIGRFVLGLLDETEVVGPKEFKEYIKNKITSSTVV